MKLRLLAAGLLFAIAPLALAQPAEQTPAEPAVPAEQAPATDPADSVAPQEETQPAEPEPTLTLRELVVLQTDRYGDTANNPQLLTTTLFNPIRHQGRAKRVNQDGGYEYAPMPLGLVTFEGAITEPIKLRLTLQSGRDQFHAHWPSDAIIGEKFLQWQDLSAAGVDDRAIPIAQKEDWLDPLRESDDRVWLQSRAGQFKERFLLYDASFRFKPSIDLTFAGGQYSLKSNVPEQAAPPLCVLVRKNDDGWTSDAVAAPWPQPSTPLAKKVSDSTAVPTLNQALAPIKELLVTRGYNEQEIKMALGMIAAAGFETSKFSLVYILPVGIIDEHIRLQIKPAPDQVIRTAIVVVNNIDPDLGSQVNALLDDLGSDQWLKRDRAQRELINLGQAAIKKVQQLKNHKNPEIAFRARQILDAHDWKMNGGK